MEFFIDVTIPNCPDEVLTEGEAGVQSVESAAVPENEQRIVTPPDSLVAQ